jgi:hypothetical protein
MGVQVLLPLAVNSKSERQAGTQLTLRLEPANFNTQAHLSDRSAKSNPLLGYANDMFYSINLQVN